MATSKSAAKTTTAKAKAPKAPKAASKSAAKGKKKAAAPVEDGEGISTRAKGNTQRATRMA